MDPATFYGCRKTTRVRTLNEARDVIQTGYHTRNVVTLPPAAGNTSQDSDVEDAIDADIDFEPAGELEVDEDLPSDSEEEEEPVEQQRKKSRKDAGTPIWKKTLKFDRVLQSENILLPQELLQLVGVSPFELFNMIFSDNLFDTIVHQTNIYASRDKNQPNFQVDKSDVRRFIGVLVVSGYHSLPEEVHYWSRQPDLGVPIIYNTISRNRFQDIKKYIHFADNQNLLQGNKFAKVMPLYNVLNTNLVRFGVFHKLLSIDESMVPYFGRHGAKMYIKGKPIKFGYKIWCLCASDGYPYALSLYQGKEEGVDTRIPLGSRIVNKMVDVIVEKSSVKAHTLFFDNFFTSYDLLSNLAEREMRATGTVRQNRTQGATKNMIGDKQLIKNGRGAFDYRCDGKVYVAKWNDNSIVGAASNYETHEPVHNVRRRVKGGEKEVSQPHLINSYNKGMGGVDLMDRLLGSYRPMIRGKKWYWPLFSNAVNIAIVAAWRIHCTVNGKKMSHLEFRREIAMCLMRKDEEPSAMNLPRCAGFPADVRFDGLNHVPVPASEGRCAMCHKNAKRMCKKCSVRLHAERGKQCFVEYHHR